MTFLQLSDPSKVRYTPRYAAKRRRGLFGSINKSPIWSVRLVFHVCPPSVLFCTPALPPAYSVDRSEGSNPRASASGLWEAGSLQLWPAFRLS
jgi:hypothetical protein